MMVILNSLSGRQLALRKRAPLAARNSRNGPSKRSNFHAALWGCQSKSTPTAGGDVTNLWKIHEFIRRVSASIPPYWWFRRLFLQRKKTPSRCVVKREQVSSHK